MLILTRQKDESVMIGDYIQVIVLGMNSNNVILGFNAPRNIPVHREEIYLRNRIFYFNKENNLKTQCHKNLNKTQENNIFEVSI